MARGFNMDRKHNTDLTSNARTLRKNMTKEERHLWYDFLKTLPVTVNRQKVIGKCIVDFYIASSKLDIEVKQSLRQSTTDTSRESPSQLR